MARLAWVVATLSVGHLGDSIATFLVDVDALSHFAHV